METYREVEIRLQAFLISLSDGGGNGRAPRSGHFTFKESVPDTRWIGGRMDLKSSSGYFQKEKSLAPDGNSHGEIG